MFKRLIERFTRPNKLTKADLNMLTACDRSVVEARVKSARLLLIDITKNIKIIASRDGDIELHADAMAVQINGVLQNLKEDPNDISRAGLSLAALEPVAQLIAGCAKAAQLNQEELFATSLVQVKAAIKETSAQFTKLRGGALVLDDQIRLEGLKSAVSALFGGKK